MGFRGLIPYPMRISQCENIYIGENKPIIPMKPMILTSEKIAPLSAGELALNYGGNGGV
jgi:hypothetical protein